MIRAVFGGKETITGTNPVQEESRIRVFPNPVSSLLHIEYDSSEHFTYALQDLNGREVLRGSDREIIGVSDLPSGLYFLRLMPSRGNTTVIKVVVRH